VGVAVNKVHGLGVKLPRADAVLNDAERVDPQVALAEPPDQVESVLDGAR